MRLTDQKAVARTLVWLLACAWRMCQNGLSITGDAEDGTKYEVRSSKYRRPSSYLVLSTSYLVPTGIRTAIAAACLAIALHGLVDSFLSFAPTFVLFSITLGLAVACRRTQTGGDAHRV